MLKKTLITIALSMIVWGCAPSTQYGSETQGDQGDAPVIIGYYAAEVIRPGATWRVYLHAQDNDGDMKDIASVLEQTGHTSYPTDVTTINKKHSGEVAGYLFLRTPLDSNLTQDRFNLKVVVRDRQGNRSEWVELPLRFGLASPEELPEKWKQVADRSLGSIGIEIKSSFERGRKTRP
jgi:hypothetical protein